jgi:hypothetical protein
MPVYCNIIQAKICNFSEKILSLITFVNRVLTRNIPRAYLSGTTARFPGSSHPKPEELTGHPMMFQASNWLVEYSICRYTHYSDTKQQPKQPKQTNRLILACCSHLQLGVCCFAPDNVSQLCSSLLRPPGGLSHTGPLGFFFWNSLVLENPTIPIATNTHVWHRCLVR